MSRAPINRRAILAAAPCMFGGMSIMAAEASPSEFLSATRYLDFKASSVMDAVRAATKAATTEREKALGIFAFVRDRIPFGFGRGFWDQTASEVLRMGRGYCNTKSTLFVAMLRGAGIPARQVFVDIDASVLDGVISPGTPLVDHSYTEVYLEGAWRRTDAYITDEALFPKAQARVQKEGGVMGYGVHTAGSCDWNGLDASFAQYNMNDPRPLGRQIWGVHADVGAFYDATPDAWNRLNSVLRAGFGVLAGQANARLDAIRGAK